MRSISLIFLLATLFSTTATADPLPQGIILNPAESALTVSVWAEKESYVAGERLRLKLRLSEAAYVYVYHIDTQGQVQLLFPNAFDTDNLMAPGTHTFPGPRYSFVVDGKPGTDAVQVIASLDPFDLIALAQAPPSAQQPFALLKGAPDAVAAQLQGIVTDAVDAARWATGWTQFQIAIPTTKRWVIRSFPGEAALYVNGELVGLTPEELTLAPPARAGQSRQVALTLVKNGYVTWTGKLNVSVSSQGKVELQPLFDDSHTAQTRLRGDTAFLDVTLQQDGANSLRLPATTVETNGQRQDEYTDIHFQRETIGGSLSANLGGHPKNMSTFGFELGLETFRVGLSIADTMDEVPEFFDVGTPVDLGSELVLNEEPEVEFYLKLSLATGLKGLAVELGAGMVLQAQAHVAASLLGAATALDVSVLPNGYRTEIFQGTGIIGLSYRAGSLLLQLGFDTHRGIVGGLGMAFEVS